MNINTHPLYPTWLMMRQRCSNPNHRSYPRYGGRGITVCERWNTSFLHFVSDMGERPDGLTLDRIDNDGNYEPSNCRWATRSEQELNKTRPIKITVPTTSNFSRSDDPLRYIGYRPQCSLHPWRLRMVLVSGGKPIDLGYFDTLEEAQAVRDETEYERAFHAALGLTTEPH